jgi:hydrogenase nickel incorporation protein HypA/HybF
VHEMGICDGILSASLDAAAKENATVVNSIDVTIGDLTEIQGEALQFAFGVLTKDTIAENAVLNITTISALSRCADCAAEFSHGRFDAKCPKCGSYMCELLQGRELRVDAIDID